MWDCKSNSLDVFIHFYPANHHICTSLYELGWAELRKWLRYAPLQRSIPANEILGSFSKLLLTHAYTQTCTQAHTGTHTQNFYVKANQTQPYCELFIARCYYTYPQFQCYLQCRDTIWQPGLCMANLLMIWAVKKTTQLSMKTTQYPLLPGSEKSLKCHTCD